MDTVVLTDGQQAIEATVSGAVRYVRCRRFAEPKAMANRSGGRDFFDVAIQIQPYEVDGNGLELQAGPIVGTTIHAAFEAGAEPVVDQNEVSRLVLRACETLVYRMEQEAQSGGAGAAVQPMTRASPEGVAQALRGVVPEVLL